MTGLQTEENGGNPSEGEEQKRKLPPGRETGICARACIKSGREMGTFKGNTPMAQKQWMS